MVAAIDIGTNSIKLAVGERSVAGEVRFLEERVIITRLGQGLSLTGLIAPEAALRTLEGLRGLVNAAAARGATEIRAVATSALREAANSYELTGSIRQELGIGVEVVSGEREAHLARRAVAEDPMLSKLAGDLTTVDVGGGSTEFTTSQRTISLKVGAVRLHEWFIRDDPPSAGEFEAAADSAERLLREAIEPSAGASVVASGGSAVNLARMATGIPTDRSSEAHGTSLTRDQLADTVRGLSGMMTKERMTLIGLDPERADIILTGAIILWKLLDVLEADRMLVSVRGVRHGLLYEMLEVCC